MFERNVYVSLPIFREKIFVISENGINFALAFGKQAAGVQLEVPQERA